MLQQQTFNSRYTFRQIRILVGGTAMRSSLLLPKAEYFRILSKRFPDLVPIESSDFQLCTDFVKILLSGDPSLSLIPSLESCSDLQSRHSLLLVIIIMPILWIWVCSRSLSDLSDSDSESLFHTSMANDDWTPNDPQVTSSYEVRSSHCQWQHLVINLPWN